jgi:hypothetical protein
MSGQSDQEILYALRQAALKDYQERKMELENTRRQLDKFKFKYRITEDDMAGIVSVIQDIKRQEHLTRLAWIQSQSGLVYDKKRDKY